MIYFISLISLLSAEVSERQLKVAVFSVRTNNLDNDLTSALTDALTDGVAQSGDYEVFSQDDILQLLSLEQKKQLLGCSDESCMVDIAGAMDVDRLVASQITKVGDRYDGSAKLLDVHAAVVLGRANGQVQSPSRMPTLMRVLGYQVMGADAPQELVDDLQEREPVPESWSVAVAGGVFLPSKMYFDYTGGSVDVQPGPTVTAAFDAMVAAKVSLGLRLQLTRTAVDPSSLRQDALPEFRAKWDTPVTIYTIAATIKGRFAPLYERWQVRPGVALGYQLSVVDPEESSAGFGVGAMVENALLVYPGLMLLLDVGFISQPVGGNDESEHAFVPSFYLQAGVEYGM